MSKEIVLDKTDFLVSETDDKGIITFANDKFCEIAGYDVDELIGKPHNIVRHPDMPRAAFKGLWDTVKRGEVWNGFVKNLAKNGDYYWVWATVYPAQGCDSNGRQGYISCRRKASKTEIKEHEELYRTLKAKE